MSDLQTILIGTPSSATPPFELIEQEVTLDDRINLWVRVPVETPQGYVTLRLDGLRLNLKRFLRYKLGQRIRNCRRQVAWTIGIYGRHDVSAYREQNRRWARGER